MVLKNRVLVVAISSVLLLLEWFFKWSIEDSLYTFIFFVATGIWYIGIIFLSLIHLIKYRRWESFAIVLATVCILFVFDITSLYVNTNFYLNEESREEIVKKAFDGKLSVLFPKTEKSPYSNAQLFKIGHSRGLFPITATGVVAKIDGCLYFSLFHYVQGIVYCRDRKINGFLSKNSYKVSKKFNNRWYWVTEK